MSDRSRLRTSRAAAVIVAAVLGVSLAACSPTTGTSGSASPAAKDHTLALPIISAPNSFDPAQLVDGQQMFVWSSIYDTLLYKENKTGDLKPDAAESWKYSADGRTLTLTLRDGMTFSNGDPVTAAAVAATMERTRSTPGIQQGKFAHVSSVTAPDTKTVVIAFAQPDPQFLACLATVCGVIGDPKNLSAARTATDPVGSGPYTLDTSATVPGTTYVLKRRNDYWNEKAFPFSTVTVKVMQDSTATLNALQSGQLNVAGVSKQMLGPIQNDPTYKVTEIPATATLMLNVLDRAGKTTPALGDVRVRQAISYALNRAGIVKALMDGVGMPTDQVFSPYGHVYDKSLNNTYDYNVATAKRLLEQAGYGHGLTLKIPSTFLTGNFEAPLSQALSAVGITLDWVAVPPQQAQSALQSGQFGIAFQIMGLGDDAVIAPNFYAQNGSANQLGYTDATLQKLFGTIDSTVDESKALPAYKELNKYAVDQQFVIPIAFSGSITVTRDGVTPLDNGASGLQTVRLYGVTG